MDNTTLLHYEALIEEGNDPVLDPPTLRAYMDGWDGQAFIDAMELNSQKSVLEIGVGTGRLAVRVAPLCADFYGIDLSPKTLARAKEHLSTSANATLLCGDFMTYAFSQSFDVIYASLVFLHIKEKKQAIEKVFSLLRADGLFALSIDKNQDTFLDMGVRTLLLYPDDADLTNTLLLSAGFSSVRTFQTERAHIFIAQK